MPRRVATPTNAAGTIIFGARENVAFRWGSPRYGAIRGASREFGTPLIATHPRQLFLSRRPGKATLILRPMLDGES